MADSRISSNAFIGDGVELGAEVTIGPGAVLLGPCTVGDRVWIGPGAAIGGPPEIASLPQNAAWTGELDHHGVEIGEDVVIREHAVVHQGSRRVTRIGRGTWLLNSCYIAHDDQLGHDVVVSAGVSIGGHVTVADGVNIGMNAVIHQGRLIGSGAMIGMGTALTGDVPPFAKVFGTPPRIHGINAVRMRRAGVDEATIESLRTLYRAGSTAATDAAEPSALAAVQPELDWWANQTDLRPVKFAALTDF